MKRDVVAAADKRVNIARDGAVVVVVVVVVET